MIVKEGADASPIPDAWLHEACRIAIAAGGEVMDVYAGEFTVDAKDDRSPLTEADRRAHRLIVDELSRLDALPRFPILSEEGELAQYAERREWSRYWLVDPLDGTKEFVKRNGEFTVNIALVEQRRPVLGVVFAPALDVLYFGAEAHGAYRLDQPGREPLKTAKPVGARRKRAQGSGGPTVVASRSHLNDETRAFINGLEARFGPCKTLSRGSSLKICLVAEAAADVYPRFAPTMEWDTAAGDAVARAAGARVTQSDGATPLEYNKEELLNPFFIVSAPWLETASSG